MALDPIKIAVAMADGLSAVCATCTKYWEARDRDLPGHQCLSTERCGSPLAGDCFHEYEGPISDLSKLCFVCGEPSKYGLRVGQLIRTIGACAEHVQMVHKVQAKGRELVPLKVNGAPPPPPDSNMRKKR
jgi:hypothetical protein